MQVADLSQNERVRKLIAMARELSTARTPLDSLTAFATYYWPLNPIDLMISLSTRDLDAGRYRVTRNINVEEVLAGRLVASRSEPWRHRDVIPVHTGGVLGAWIADGRPKLIREMDVPDDPVLGDALRHQRSALVVPVYHEGEPVYWTLQLRRRADAFTPEEVERAMIVSNLVGGNNTRLLLVSEVKSLNDKLRGQLEEVARVQRSLLPRANPDIPGVEIATSYLTSDEAGGDYYDFFPFPEGTWGMLIADVSGHGPAAATIMAMLRGILHAYGGPDLGPDAVLRYANARLTEAGIEGSFVTAFFGVYDPRDASFTYARAGHNPPLLKDGTDGAVTTLNGAGSLPLGILDDLPMERERIVLKPMDTVVLYTDGITEAMNASREMFGPERLEAALTRCTGQPDCVVDTVHSALFEHTHARTRVDDQTLVALRFRGTDAAPRT
ncbi:MAG: PP2C family protein-serine/threonine phosphatase [Phycisphaerales bacterium]